jgi:hypothetical protein
LKGNESSREGIERTKTLKRRGTHFVKNSLREGLTPFQRRKEKLEVAGIEPASDGKLVVLLQV